jgi:hypothetical protein
MVEEENKERLALLLFYSGKGSKIIHFEYKICVLVPLRKSDCTENTTCSAISMLCCVFNVWTVACSTCGKQVTSP